MFTLSGGGGESDSEFATGEAYEILSNQRRRYAVHYLKQVDDAVSVRDLAEQVAAWENDKPIEQLDSQERKRVYISLTQSHLSTLDDADIIEFDEQANTVELTDATASADIYLEIVPERDIPWSYFYLGLSAAFAFLLSARWLEIGVLADVSLYVIGGVIVATYSVAAVVQTRERSRAKLGDDGPPPEVRDS